MKSSSNLSRSVITVANIATRKQISITSEAYTAINQKVKNSLVEFDKATSRLMKNYFNSRNYDRKYKILDFEDEIVITLEKES